MRRLMLAACVVAGLAVMPSSAQAWDANECADWYAKTGQIHEDCKWWTPPPPPEPEQIEVCRDGVIVTIPETAQLPTDTAPPCPVPPTPPEPETPVPPTPPTPPEPPAPETPDTPGPNIPEPLGPDDLEPKEESDIGTPVLVEGKERVPSNEEIVEADTDTLPYTGLPILAMFLLGGALSVGGKWLRGRTFRG
jgi:hypothetical protein